MIIVFFILFYAIYQTPFLLLALCGGFVSAQIIHKIIYTSKIITPPQKLYIIHGLFAPRLQLFYRIAMSATFFLILFCLTCFGNIFENYTYAPDVILNAIITPIRLPGIILTTKAPFGSFCGLLFVPYCICFIYYFAKKSDKTVIWCGVCVFACLYCGALLPVGDFVDILGFQIHVEYGLLIASVAIFLILAQNKKQSQIIYATVLITTVYFLQYNIIPTLNSSFSTTPINPSHRTITTDADRKIVSDSSYINKFRAMHNIEEYAKEELLTLHSPQSLDLGRLLIKFASYNDFDGVNLFQSAAFNRSSIAAMNGNALDLSENVNITLNNYDSLYLPLPIMLNTDFDEHINNEYISKNYNLHISNIANKLSIENNLYFSENLQTLFSDMDTNKLEYNIKFNNSQSPPQNIKKPKNLSEYMSKITVTNNETTGDLPYFRQWMDGELQKFSDILDNEQKFANIFGDLMYYSHLSYSSLEPDGEFTWKPFRNYYFASTQSGHNSNQIDRQIFEPILRGNPLCDVKDDKSPCALAFGDDLQFAIAGYLIATTLNLYPLITLGANVPPDGIIRGENTTIWLEFDTGNSKRSIFPTKPRTDNNVPVQMSQNMWLSYVANMHKRDYQDNISQKENESLDASGQLDKKNEQDIEGQLGIIPFQIIQYFVIAFAGILIIILLTRARAYIRAKLLKQYDFTNKVSLYWKFFTDDLVVLFRVTKDNFSNIPRQRLVNNIIDFGSVQNYKIPDHISTKIADFAKDIDHYSFTLTHNFSRSDCIRIARTLYDTSNQIIRQLYQEIIRQGKMTPRKFVNICRYNISMCIAFSDLCLLLHNLVQNQFKRKTNRINCKIYARKSKHSNSRRTDNAF